MIGVMIEINIWKEWILNHAVIKFGWIKINIDGDMIMSCHVNIIYFQLMCLNIFWYLCTWYLCWYTNSWLDIGMNIFLWLLEGIGVDVHTDIGYICAIKPHQMLMNTIYEPQVDKLGFLKLQKGLYVETENWKPDKLR